MENIREIISENLTLLRKQKNMTQAEVAEIFNYSDKAVSKWEKGDTMPDIETLKAIADYYGVTLDFLTHSGNKEEKAQYVKTSQKRRLSKIAACALLCCGILSVATLIFVYSMLYFKKPETWLAFVWMVPLWCTVIWFFNKFSFRKLILTTIITSIFTWSCITSLYLTIGVVQEQWNMWLIFLVGIPVQLAVLLYYGFKK